MNGEEVARKRKVCLYRFLSPKFSSLGTRSFFLQVQEGSFPLRDLSSAFREKEVEGGGIQVTFLLYHAQMPHLGVACPEPHHAQQIYLS